MSPMALEAAFDELRLRLLTARDAILELKVTVVEDKPLRGEAALVDGWGDAVEDLAGAAHEAVEAAGLAQQAVAGHPPDIDAARRALACCHALTLRLARRFWSDLASYERVGDLARLARRRRGEWPSWSASVRLALGRCHLPLQDADSALLCCWQEIGERVGMSSVTLSANNIGRQVVVPAAGEVFSRPTV
jgi:hypothetical protein